jgi:AcrR family transcriptional regulator
MTLRKKPDAARGVAARPRAVARGGSPGSAGRRASKPASARRSDAAVAIRRHEKARDNAAPALRQRASRKRLSPDDRRAQIVDIVEEFFKTRPYSELGIGDVAAAAGVTEGLVYHYFPSKEALFMAAFEVRAEELLAFCRPDPALSLMEQVERGVNGYIDFVEAHSVAYLNLFTGSVAAEEAIQRVCTDARWRIVDRFIAALGLGERALPVTRLSLRGYLGYSESVILEWLEHRRVPRATIERMLFAVIGTALLVGLSSEDEPLPPDVLAERDAEYRRYFSLP